MQESENLWNEEQLLIEMEKMQDQIDLLHGEKDQWRQETLRGQQTISELSSQVSLLKSELQKKSEKIEKLTGAEMVLEENNQLKKENRELILKAEKAVKEADTMARSCKQEISQKESDLREKMMQAQADISAARQKEAEIDSLIKDGVRRQTSWLKEEYESRNMAIQIKANRRNKEFRDSCFILFTLTGLYGLLITLFTALESETVCKDMHQFARGLRNGLIIFVTAVHKMALLTANLTDGIPYIAIRVLLYGLLYIIITAAIYGILVIMISIPVKKYMRFFLKKQADEFTLFLLMACIATPVFFANEIKTVMSLNLAIVMLILFSGCMTVRGILLMKDKRIRNGILGTAGALTGGLVLLILVGEYAGIGGVIGMLIAAVIIPATD